MKKVIALLLALAMVLSVSAAALAATEKPVKLSIMKSADDSVYEDRKSVV